MEYLLFSYPNCSKCEDLKKTLVETPVDFKEYSLVEKESKLKIRDFLKHVKRDQKGAITLPALIVLNDTDEVTVLNTREEFKEWWISRD
ncbi:MAG: glutaredoxin domain-containing protein [Acidobacteriota bacterium]|nr:glutaredoxin domain-containing protein [Acidobacteriota bacterium]